MLIELLAKTPQLIQNAYAKAYSKGEYGEVPGAFTPLGLTPYSLVDVTLDCLYSWAENAADDLLLPKPRRVKIPATSEEIYEKTARLCNWHLINQPILEQWASYPTYKTWLTRELRQLEKRYPLEKKPKYYTVDEAAQEAGIHRVTLFKWMKNGLPSQKIENKVLISRKELQTFLSVEKAKRKRIDL